MSLDLHRLRSAYHAARAALLSERIEGHWVGELSTSALSTATAVSALSLVRRAMGERSASLSPLIDAGVKYLVEHQNADGGWGDTDRSYSNIATSMLGVAAIHLAGYAERLRDTLVLA